MTSFVAWGGIDSRSMSSFYFASGSRISWGVNAKWDSGRKLFTSSTHPDIFGFCGDVLFPSLVLIQIVNLVDNGCLFVANEPPSEKFKKLSDFVYNSFNSYPNFARNAFTIVYCSRIGIDIVSKFELYTLDWNIKDGWKTQIHLLPSHTKLVLSLGSGKESIQSSDLEWQKTTVSGTSRSIFAAFCDSLKSQSDPLTGGAPQLIGLYRKDSARNLGVIYNQNRYLFGLIADQFVNLSSFDWRNELFERCDPYTMAIMINAQRQPQPKM